MKISLSMPYLLEGTYRPKWVRTVDGNRAHLATLRQHSPKQIATFQVATSKNAWPIMHCRHLNLDVYYVEHNDTIKYCVEVKALKTTGLASFNTLSQTSVWRDKNFNQLPGLAKWVFYNVLVPVNRNIMSDAMQSKEGRNFWSIRMAEALSSHKNVYALMLQGKEAPDIKHIEQITSVDDLDQYYTTDKDWSGQYWRLLITDKQLRYSANTGSESQQT